MPFPIRLVIGPLFSIVWLTASAQPISLDSARLRNTHSLSLPDWGPYSKRYIGVSHLPDNSSGLRFDLTVFPGFYRQKVLVPNVVFESGYHPWEATPDLSYFAFRHELEWKDQVYADISFATASKNARLIRSHLVNNTARPQSMVLHYMASLNLPDVRPMVVSLPQSAVWVGAMTYTRLQFAKPRPQDNLTYDGWLNGEVRESAFVGGSALGKGFGQDVGDQVSYRVTLASGLSNGMLLLRYRIKKGDTARLRMDGFADAPVVLAGTGEMAVQPIPLGVKPNGVYTLTFTSTGTTPLEMDGFAVVENAQVKQVTFSRPTDNVVPELTKGPTGNSLLVNFAGVDQFYGMAWNAPSSEVRQIFNDELDIFLRKYVHEHVAKELHGNDLGHFTNVFVRPIPIGPKSVQTLYGLVCSGTRAEVEQQLRDFAAQSSANHEAVYVRARQLIEKQSISSAGKTYQFSQERMRATTLTNVVYPVYTQGTYIKHYPPGRWWNSLYTWDSGFIGLGLAEAGRGPMGVQRAIECLNAYTTEPGNPSAFIHHGSPVPVQIYLFQELWNRTQSRELLTYFYPRLRQYYRFIVGRSGSSTMRMPSNLLRTWDYFYNSGGWDDYPSQKAVHAQKLEATVAPVINTAHGIRTAKIMRLAALALGNQADIQEYDKDIADLSTALQTHAWDEQAGYFGYVTHDAAGKPNGLFRDANGVNFNRGLDGAYPLLAGICTLNQRQKLLGHLASDTEMWTPIGLSVVDRSAPYYKTDGYWNGAVWMPHQWFFWKTMLDLGEGDQAFKIAKTGLDVWKAEVETSYNCFEHFLIETGRGAGWHHFGGLSTPVLSWFGAYYQPGRLTVGFDVWIADQQFSNDNTALSARLTLNPGAATDNRTIIVSMNPAHQYRVRLNDKELSLKSISPGVLQVTIPGNLAGVRLQVTRL